MGMEYTAFCCAICPPSDTQTNKITWAPFASSFFCPTFAVPSHRMFLPSGLGLFFSLFVAGPTQFEGGFFFPEHQGGRGIRRGRHPRGQGSRPAGRGTPVLLLLLLLLPGLGFIRDHRSTRPPSSTSCPPRPWLCQQKKRVEQIVCLTAEQRLLLLSSTEGGMYSDRNGAVVPEQTVEEVNRLQRTSSMVDLALRDGVPFPQRPAINQALPYMNMLTRTFSVPNVHQYSGAIGPYRPSMPVYSYNTYKSYFPYRNYRGYTLADAYWYDRYYYFSPIYKRSMFPIRYRHSDFKSNPSYWHYPHTYWNHPYQGKWYDYDNPANYRPYFDPKRSSSFARPYHYRSHLLAHPFNHPQGMIHKRF